MDAQVLVVGGGPAGSTAAYELARRGIDVCVLEKHEMPRYKTCGGGVNVRAARLLPFDISPVVERTIYRYRFTYRGERPFERYYHAPLTYMTQRMRLDKYLLDQARAVGARTLEGVTVRKVEVTPESAKVRTDSGLTLEAQVIVGADGAHSVVARDLGLMGETRREIALESEIALTPSEMKRWRDTCEIDLFSVWCGYGWVFPKEEHISIGVGGLREQMKGIQDYNKRYLALHGLSERKPLRFSGHALPIRTGYSPVMSGRGLLLGDAAGLLEPFTGEGIGYAVKSAQLAAATVASYVRGEAASLAGYEEALDLQVTPELIDARRYVRLFNRFPGLFYRLVRDSDYVWNAVCLILRGDRHFADIDRRLGVFRHALALL